jgi:hypothetical protein
LKHFFIRKIIKHKKFNHTPHKPILEEHSIYRREARATATRSRMLKSEDIATVRKKS